MPKETWDINRPLLDTRNIFERGLLHSPKINRLLNMHLETKKIVGLNRSFSGIQVKKRLLNG